MRKLVILVALAVAVTAMAMPATAAPKGGSVANDVTYSEPGGYKVTVFYDTVTYPGTPYAATVKKQQSTVTIHAGSIDTLDSEMQQLYGFGLTQEARDFLASQG